METCNCYFISQSDFYEYDRTDLQVGTNPKKVAVAISDSQIDMELLYICAPLKNELCTQLNAGTLTDLNKNLLKLIADVQVRLAYGYLIPMLQSNAIDQGYVNKISDASIPVENKQMRLDSESWKNKSTKYVNALLVFMEANVIANPLYNCKVNDCEHVTNKTGWDIM